MGRNISKRKQRNSVKDACSTTRKKVELVSILTLKLKTTALEESTRKKTTNDIKI